MLQPATVNVTLSGGVVPFGDSGTSISLLSPALILTPDPNTEAGGQGFLRNFAALNADANVIHSAQVSINPPDAGP